jgi:steroid delta-isomerase-like uncharacterized protein
MKKYLFTLIAFSFLVGASCQEKVDIEKNKDFIQNFNEDFWNKHNIAAFDQYFTTDFIAHFVDGDQNAEQYKGICQAYFAAFPDMHVTINDVLAEGDKVVKVWTVNSTSKGDFMGIPATGKPMVLKGMEVFRIANGKIAELWVSMDNLGMLTQLGVIPPMGE